MAGGVPYLGSKISLVSRSEIRYEGILYTIDAKDSTLALAKVKSFGTEDRPTQRPLGPRDEVYEYIIFRANDIKDLRVSEPPKPPCGLLGATDPAIVQHSAPIPPFLSSSSGCLPHYPAYTKPQVAPPFILQPPPKKSAPLTFDASVQVSTGPLYIRQRSDSARSDPRRSPMPPQSGRNGNPRRGEASNRRNAPPYRQGSRGPPTPGYRPRRPPRRYRYPSYSLPSPGAATLRFESSFDFEASNAKFKAMESKDPESDCENKAPEESPPMEEAVYYDRSQSFFDKISCFSIDGSNGIDWRKERSMNQETFGAIYSWSQSRGSFGGVGFSSRGNSRGGGPYKPPDRSYRPPDRSYRPAGRPYMPTEWPSDSIARDARSKRTAATGKDRRPTGKVTGIYAKESESTKEVDTMPKEIDAGSKSKDPKDKNIVEWLEDEELWL